MATFFNVEAISLSICNPLGLPQALHLGLDLCLSEDLAVIAGSPMALTILGSKLHFVIHLSSARASDS